MRVSRNPEVIDSTLDNEICLFLPSKAEYFNLNSTGSFIWKILEKPCSVQYIISEVLKIYDTNKLKCSKEINTFIAQALRSGIILNIN